MLNPSSVDVVGPEPVMLVPMYIVLATESPPDKTTAAVPSAVASVTLVNVTAPEADNVVAATDPAKLDAVIVLLLKASVPARVASVPVVGNVTFVAAVEVSVVLNAPDVANVPPEAIVKVPVVLVMVKPLTVLLVSASVPARVARVPVVGNVIDVFAVAVSVVVKAPAVVKLPPSVMVLVPLLTPVPPYVGLTMVPCQVPVAIVPSVVILV